MPHETEAGSHRVVILTYALWRRHFGGDPSIVGRPTSINSEPYTVIGVLPSSVSFPSNEYALLAPLVTRGDLPGAPPTNRVARYLRVVGRLDDDVAETAAREELGLIGRRLAEAYPETNETVSIGMTNMAADMVANAEADLIVALVGAGVVLLVACLNTAGLAIARGSARARELAVRAAIGASRARLVRQLATEALVTFLIGGALGLAVAAWSVSALASFLPASVPRVSELTVDWRFLAFGGVLTLGAGLLFSALPALSIARRGPLADLHGARRLVSAGRATQRTRGALIVAQVAAAIVLLAGAALAVRSFDRVRRVDAGFEPAQTMTFGFVMRDRQYPTGDDLRAFVGRVSTTLGDAPGIDAAGITTHLPLSDQNLENGFTVDGSPVEPGEDPPIAGLRGVGGQYRVAIGARLLQGRDLLPADTAASQPVAVVTAGFVQRHVRTTNPIGARLKMGGADSSDPWRTIVGVIADIRHNELDEAPRPEVWLPFAQMPDDVLTTWLRGVYCATRTAIDPPSAISTIRAGMRALDPALPLVDLHTLGDLAQASTAERRAGTYLLAAFAALALVLAAIGLFGVLAFHVVQHVPEFGVRLALGATPSGLLALVFRRGLTLLGIGLALGIPGAMAMGQGMSALLYGITPHDPIALLAAAVALLVVTLAACAVPAYRAMKIDPLVAIRHE